jgi:DNA polymerase-3 subunit beta
MIKFFLKKKEIFKQIRSASSIANKKHLIPMLGCILFKVFNKNLVIKVSDTEIEIEINLKLNNLSSNGILAVSSKKLLDILSNFLEENTIKFIQSNKDKILLLCGKSKFKLSCLDADLFPTINQENNFIIFEVSFFILIKSIKLIQFSMSNNDVRYFLNGRLWDIKKNVLKLVTTDGYRLSMTIISIKDNNTDNIKIIVPYKTINEISKFFFKKDFSVKILISTNYIKIILLNIKIISKLIDSNYLYYENIIPINNFKILSVNRIDLINSLKRVLILSNNIHNGVKMILKKNILQLYTSNSENEYVNEHLLVHYNEDKIEISFNIYYFLDIINILNTNYINVYFNDYKSSILLKENLNNALYVLSPITFY